MIHSSQHGGWKGYSAYFLRMLKFVLPTGKLEALIDDANARLNGLVVKGAHLELVKKGRERTIYYVGKWRDDPDADRGRSRPEIPVCDVLGRKGEYSLDFFKYFWRTNFASTAGCVVLRRLAEERGYCPIVH